MTKQEFAAKRAKLETSLNVYAQKLWLDYCEIFPKLVKFDCPKIKLNARLTRTAGRCFQESNFIDLGLKFFEKMENRDYMIKVILPHELAHQIDFDLYGESELACGHGKMWQMVMKKIGQEVKKFHSMSI